MDILNIETKQVVPGMILAEDVYTPSQEKILFRNTILNAKSIAKLKVHGINKITVFIPKNLADQNEDIRYEHLNKTKKTIEFKKFRKQYVDTTSELKNFFGYLSENQNAEFSMDKVRSLMSGILAETTNSIRTFEMLQCMREYDDLTYVHSLNVSLISRALGGWLGLSGEDVELLTVAGLLHDIGKVMIPQDIINKPGSLTDDEYKMVKNHPSLGYEIVKDLNIDDRIKSVVIMHHERCDGSGYPNRLTSAEISPFAKIVAIADVYDAMTASRVYRQAICPFDVVDTFESEGYAKYDVQYLLTFLKNIVQSYINAPVLLSNSLTGEVVMINQAKLSRPIVNVNGEFFDLSKTPDLKIKCIL